MNNISKLLDCLAKTGVCQTGRRYLNSTGKDIETFIKVWRGWPEYWYEHSETAIKAMRTFLTEDDKNTLAKELLFTDYEGKITLNNRNSFPVFIVGKSNIVVNVPSYAVAKIYLFNEAKAMFNVEENAIINIETFDMSSIKVNNRKAQCTVYKYDQSEITGNVRVINKQYLRGEIFNGKEIQSKTY